MARIRRRKKKRGKGRISVATAAKEAHEKVMKRTKPGTGARFASLVELLKKKKGIRSPEALAAWRGRQKYTKKKFQEMAAKGRKKKRRRRK